MTTRERFAKYLAVTLAVVIVLSVVSASVSSVVGIVRFAKEKKEERRRAASGGIAAFTDLEGLHSLSLSPGDAELEIREGESAALSYYEDAFTVSFKDGVLTLSPVPGIWDGAKPVVLTLPKGMELDAAAVYARGSVRIDALYADSLTLSLDGDAEIGALTAFSSAYLETGAGAVRISGGYLNALTLNGGAGGVTLVSTLTGESALVSGGGKIEARLVGLPEDYGFFVSGDKVRINTVPVDPAAYGGGNAKVALNGEAGPITVTIETAK